MTRKITACAVALIAFLLLCCAPFSVLAAETTLTTTVPEFCTVKLEITGNGKVEINGKCFTESTEIQVKRHSDVDITVISDAGCKVQNITCSGESILSKLQGGTLTITDIKADLVLEFSFCKVGDTPSTGDNLLRLWVYSTMLSMTCTMIIMLKRQSRHHSL